MSLQATHYSFETGMEVPAHTVSGQTGFISWRRLAEVLRAAGELKPHEIADTVQVDLRGLAFRVR